MRRLFAALPPIAALLLGACADHSSPVAPVAAAAPHYQVTSNDVTRGLSDVVTFCDGTVLTLDGQQHVTSRVTTLPNGDYHLGWHSNIAGTATSATGERYTYNSAFNEEYNVTPGLTATMVQHIYLIGHDGATEKFSIMGRTTVDANGDITAQKFAESDPTCPAAAQ